MHQLPTEPAVRIESRFSESRREVFAASVTLDRFREFIDAIERQPQRLADVTHRRLGSIGDDFGGHAAAFAAVLRVGVLQHDLAAFVLEVDVDVGGFVAFGGDEPLEEQIVPLGIDGRHAQAITDRAVRCRSATLAQDLLAPRKAHQVMHRQEVRFVLELLDQPEFVTEQRLHFVGHARGIAFSGSFPSKPREIGNCGFAGRNELFRIFVLQFVEPEVAAAGDLERASHGVGSIAEELPHRVAAFEMTLAVRRKVFVELVYRLAESHAGEDREQKASLGVVHQRSVRRDERQTGLLREIAHAGESELVFRPEKQPREPVTSIAERLAILVQPRQHVVHVVGRRHMRPQRDAGNEALLEAHDIVERELALAFLRTSATDGEQPCEIRVACAVCGEQNRGRCVVEHDFGSDELLQPRLFRCDVRADDSGETVDVGDTERGITEFRGTISEFIGMRRRCEEREVRSRINFREARWFRLGRSRRFDQRRFRRRRANGRMRQFRHRAPSPEQTVQEPVARSATTKQPQPLGLVGFDPPVIATSFRRIGPAGFEAFGTECEHKCIRASAAREPERRSVGMNRQHAHRFGLGTQQNRPRRDGFDLLQLRKQRRSRGERNRLYRSLGKVVARPRWSRDGVFSEPSRQTFDEPREKPIVLGRCAIAEQVGSIGRGQPHRVGNDHDAIDLARRRLTIERQRDQREQPLG